MFKQAAGRSSSLGLSDTQELRRLSDTQELRAGLSDTQELRVGLSELSDTQELRAGLSKRHVLCASLANEARARATVVDAV